MEWRTSRLAILLIASLIITPAAQAADDLPDLIPADCLVAFGIRSVADLRTKGDGFLKAAGIENDEWRISKLVTTVYQILGFRGCVDETRPVLIVGMPTAKGMIDIEPVLLVPFKDFDQIAATYGFKKGEMKRDTLTPLTGDRPISKFCYARGNHLLLGNNGDVVAAVARSKRKGPALSQEDREKLAKEDLVLFLNAEVMPDDWKKLAAQIKTDLKPGNDHEAKVADQLVRTLESVRYLTFSAHIDNGLSLRLAGAFPKDLHPDVSAFLKVLASGSGPSSLQGLPTGNVIGAFSGRMHGSQTAVLMRLLLSNFFRTSPTANNLFLPADQPLIAGVFANLWGHIQGRRLAIYQNSNEARHGLFSMIAILDSDDPQKLMNLIGEMAKFAEGKDLDLSDKSGKATVQAIQKLVHDLGDDDFATRESATLKLVVVGEPALQWLKKAAESDDAEVRIRATPLVKEISERAADRRKALLNAEESKRIRPGFVLTPAAEKLDGLTVDVVQVKLGKEDKGAVEQLEQLFGPQWMRIRLVTVGKQVIVLVGSDVDLFRETMTNVRKGAAGLADDSTLKGFTKQARPDRAFELHLAMQSLDGLLDPNGFDPAKLKAGQLTSMQISGDAGQIEITLWAPPPQFNAVVKALRLLP